MTAVVGSTGRWMVSARGAGEVLVARHHDADLGIVVALVAPPGGIEGVQAALAAIAEASRAAAAQAAPGGPLAPALHQTLARLIAGPLCDAGAGCALVLLDDGRTVESGSVGDAEVHVWRGRRPAAEPSLRLRDANGREARAQRFEGDETIRLVIGWPAGRASSDAPGVAIEATWDASPAARDAVDAAAPEPSDIVHGYDALDPTASAATMGADGDASAADPRPRAGASPGEEPGFFEWLDRLIDQRGEGAPASTPAAGEDGDLVPPTPEPEWLTARTAPAPERVPALAPGSGMAAAAERDPSFMPQSSAVAPVSERDPAFTWGSAFLEDAPTASVDAPPLDAAAATRSAPPASTTSPAFAAPVTEAAAAAAVAAPAPVGEAATVEAPARVADSSEAAISPAPGWDRARPLRPSWPSAEELEPPPGPRPWMMWAGAALAVALVLGGVWALASREGAFGFLQGPQFTAAIESTPPGARIVVDGRQTGLQTPATVSLKPGDREVTLVLPGRGSVTRVVAGARGDRAELAVLLAGSLQLDSTDPNIPVAASLDGRDLGYLPVSLDQVPAGPHEVRFRAPGMEPWSETIDLGVGEHRAVVARPFQVPATGVLEVRATRLGPAGTETLRGATVWIDGERRGTTPLEIELGRGPHSVRARYQDEELPVQVVDLPGGNHRFVDFAFGTDAAHPRLARTGPEGAILQDPPSVVSAALTGVLPRDLREMWLHVREPEGTWRRYPMEVFRSGGAMVGTAEFPVELLDAHGRATYYVSAVTQLGDEYYTELVTPRSVRAAARRPLAPTTP